jgi:hypothetical protein
MDVWMDVCVCVCVFVCVFVCVCVCVSAANTRGHKTEAKSSTKNFYLAVIVCDLSHSRLLAKETH